METTSTESVHQKLEETSASLAAALQAVEEKIKQEDGQAAEYVHLWVGTGGWSRGERVRTRNEGVEGRSMRPHGERAR